MEDTMVPGRRPLDDVAAIARGLLVLVGAACALAVAATLLLRQVDIPSPVIVAYVAATPFVPLAGILGLVVLLLARCWSGATIAGVLTVVLLLTQAPMYLGSAAPDGPVTTVTVMTSNMHFGLGDADLIVDAVRRLDVDVLALQELTPDAVTALEDAGVDEVLPYSVLTPRRGASGVGMWSSRPLEAMVARVDFVHPPVTAMMDVDGHEVFVAAVHPVSPFPDDTTEWANELGRLTEWLDPLDGPAIVAGDFNATIDHRQFRNLLAAGYRDAAEQVGAGFLPTFPAQRRRLPLLITIDHVLTGGGVVATDLRRVGVTASDHEALVAVVAVPDERRADAAQEQTR